MKIAMHRITQKLAALKPGIFGAVVRGIEKENLRVTEEGLVARDEHPRSLGSALTHPHITTDFAESLIELITDPAGSYGALEEELHRIHQFVYQHLASSQLLWPGSMPGLLEDLDQLPIAYYGTSHIGRLKAIYREGLVHRYGKKMQMIAGLHYNFSLPSAFFSSLLQHHPSQAEISSLYMNLVRHFYCHYWMLPYLFGASPLCMRTSLDESQVPDYLKKLDQDTWFGSHATSLRMSDLGYRNSGQLVLKIAYESVLAYSASLFQATQTRDPTFAKIGLKKGDHYLQLSDAVLQIENEYYNPIRPKQPTQYLERPAYALASRGVRYIEVRVLDLNPFEPLGITPSAAYFMDVFLVFCMLQDTETLSPERCQRCKDRFHAVVTRGRDPDLKLELKEGWVSFQEAADRLFEPLLQCAELMDRGLALPVYESAILHEYQKIQNVALTPSAKVLKAAEQEGYAGLMLRLGREHRAFYHAQKMIPELRSALEMEARISLDKTRALERESTENFDVFLEKYLSNAP